MAAHTVTKAKTATLTASTVDSVTVTDPAAYVEVIHHANVTQPLYLRVGLAASSPTVAGNNFEVVLSGERVRFAVPPQRNDFVVSLICAGAATYSVVGVL